ncbi:hypothetical protein BKA70DRAFT_834780 [Coprinopsis sp. MPI-PUGE-AT-0042]|nr:hypothetical protein BKA70DRAFT_834780 [Coprinopsis sp. MPI-PUGE-AT-0042]
MASVPTIPTQEAMAIPQHSQDGASQLNADHQNPQAAGGSVVGDPKDDQTVRSLSHAPEQLHPHGQQQHEPSLMGQQQLSVPRQSYLEPSPSERVQDNFFLVVTLGLAAAIWIMTLVSQAYVSARVSEVYVGTAWFALVIQLVLIVLMAYLLFTTYLPPYHIQLSTLAALAIVFGVIAIDLNIRTPNSPSRRAIAASWFVNVFIDLFWVFYFTSPPQAGLVQAVHNMRGPTPSGAGKGAGIEGGMLRDPNGMDQPMQLRPISGVSTMKSAHPSGLSPVAEGSIGGTASRPGTLRKAGSKRDSQRQSTALDTQGSQRKSGWSFYGKDKQQQQQQQGMEGHEGPVASGSAMGAGAAAGPSLAPAPEAGVPPVPDMNQTLPRAEALFTYTAAKEDPAELSFKKGEILYIVDRTGKWWEARKPDGSSGSEFPSNYLRILS